MGKQQKRFKTLDDQGNNMPCEVIWIGDLRWGTTYEELKTLLGFYGIQGTLHCFVIGCGLI